MRKLFFTLLLLLPASLLKAQANTINPALLKGSWQADWISCPGIAQRAYGVYHFRKAFEISAKPDKFVIHISADNRYRLFVNGHAVCSGPARGNLYNWDFETVDIAPFLQSGKNIIAVLVWNMGEYAAVAQVSNQTALVVQGDTGAENRINTNSSWKVYKDNAYTPCSTDNGERLHAYMVTGPGDHVKGKDYPYGWEQLNYADSSWQQARPVMRAEPAGYGSDNLWTLVPRTIPLMEETMQRIKTIRRSSGIDPVSDFISGKDPLTVPAHKTVSILLDQSYETVAYPELIVSGGKGAVIKMTYAEALFKGFQKGNRNDIEGREIMGNYDIFQPDGGEKRLFRPLWFRTFRYLQLDITTGDQPLVINDLYGKYTGYPFKQVASFSSNDTSLKQIWETGWRTARLCAGETYFDCPYYEQLQYEGDTRIQSLISLYVTGDDRLMRKAINDFYNSRVPEGLTQGRYPSNRLQVIPPFSLFWVSMLHDYWMLRKDDAFLQKYLMAARGVLDWYEQHIDRKRDMLGPMDWWSFTDWDDSFPGGTPDGANNGNSSIITLQYVYTLRQAAELFNYFGDKTTAAHYAALAEKLAVHTYQQCFDKARGEMANTPEKKTFSQHAGIMGVLAGSIPPAQAKAVMQKVLNDRHLSQATFYYRFYLTQALKKAGMADLYYSQLAPWRDMLKIGLTTFAEKPEPTRSDCHAWSASPLYDFLATICGIMPASPGFGTVTIKPALGALKEVNAVMPHPDGLIKVSLVRQGANGIKANISLPGKLTGKFIWNNKEVLLKGGEQQIKL